MYIEHLREGRIDLSYNCIKKAETWIFVGHLYVNNMHKLKKDRNKVTLKMIHKMKPAKMQKSTAAATVMATRNAS